MSDNAEKQVRRLPLRALAPEAVPCLNAIPRPPEDGWPIQLGAEGYRLRTIPALEARQWGLTIRFTWGTTRGALFADCEGCSEWLAGLVGADLTPPVLQTAAIEGVLSPLLDELSRKGGLPLALEDMAVESKTAFPESAQFFFTLTREKDGLVLACAISLAAFPPPVQEAFGKILAGVPGELSPCEAATVPLSVTIGRTLLPAAEAAGLARGDVVLVDVMYPLDGDRVVLRSGADAWNAVWKTAGQIELQGAIMPENNEEASVPETAGAEGVPVLLTLEIDSQSVSLDRLRQFAPGHVIQTEKTPQSPVTIKAGAAVLGVGELVDVGGRVGVRILKLG